jgi:Flp pilus assembly pilin Flp
MWKAECEGTRREMLKAIRKITKDEKGQAMAEYFVLIPGSILMVLASYSLVSHPIKRAFCDVVGVFTSGICATAEVEEVDRDRDKPKIEVIHTPTPEICVVLQESEGCSQCDQSGSCTCLPGTNAGTYDGADDIDSFVIKAGKEYHIYHTGYTDDGCYHVTIDGDMASWEKVGTGSTCKDVSHLQTWYTPVCE